MTTNRLWMAFFAAVALTIVSPAWSQDALNVGSLGASPGATVDIPISVRDLAATPLGIDAGAGNRIQGIAISISFSPASSVTGATIVRSGISASLTPLFETTASTSGTISYLASFSETTNPLVFTQPPSTTGNEVLKLRLTFSAAATGTMTLTPQPATTMLSNQAGTVGESVDNGNLSLGSGTVTFTAISTATTTSVVSSANPSALGQSVTFTAIVSPTSGSSTPTGTVLFKADGANIGAAVSLSAGSASVSTSSLAVGTHTITANYGGNGSFGASAGTLSGGQVVHAYSTPAYITSTGGTPQSVKAGQPFPTPLRATVKDSFGNVVPGVLVSFTAPSSGASGTFAGGGATATATTGPNGIAAAPTFTANGLFGSYQVVATAPGVSNSAYFSLSNQQVAAVPTLTGWGLLMLVLLMAWIGYFVLRRP